MNDLERDLRDLLETRSREGTVPSTPAPAVLRRARRRQVGTVLTAAVGTAAVVVGAVVGLRAVNASNPEPRPGGVPTIDVGEDGIALPFAAITPPEGWTVLVPEGDMRIVQLTNFEPEFGTACFDEGAIELPPLGAILIVERFADGAEPTDPAWPVTLSEAGPEAPPCRGAQEETFGGPEVFSATWQEGTTRFVATAAFGGEAPDEVRELMTSAFGSMRVFPDEPLLEPLGDSPAIALDSSTTPIGTVTLYAYRDGFEGGTSWLGVAGPAGSGLTGAGSIGDEIPTGDESVTMILDAWGGVVWGDVAAVAERAELRTVEGVTFPAELIALPSDLLAEGHAAVWGVVEGETSDRVTTILYDTDGNVLNGIVPVGPRVTIATGTDPEGGPWELYLDVTSEGTGLGFGFEQGGGGGGCCLTPLEGDLRLDGFGSGGGEPSDITALASDAVARVVFEASSGATFEGGLYPVPDESLGIAQVALVIVPSGVEVAGDLIALDADGNELGREAVGDLGEPVGPTPEIDAVWSMLRQARDAVASWASEHDSSFKVFTLASLADSAQQIAWNVSGQGKPVPGEVSVRGVAPAGGSESTGWSGWKVVLVSITPDLEHTYCIAVNIDENGGGNYRYGTQDAASYEECRGGW
jgi:hypothetical protein